MSAEARKWTYCVYSATVARYDEEGAEIFRLDTKKWNAVEDLDYYRRILEEGDPVSYDEAMKIVAEKKV